MHKLTQELGEFNDAIQKYRGIYCKTKYETLEEVESELSDLLFNIVSLCNKLGINVDRFPELI
jgi:NTP pyrophosphatase (non-canonical NTP hydrolase)